MEPLTFQNLHRWRKCSFLQSMLLSNCGKFVVVKPNTLVILAIFLVKMQYSMLKSLFYLKNVTSS